MLTYETIIDFSFVLFNQIGTIYFFLRKQKTES